MHRGRAGQGQPSAQGQGLAMLKGPALLLCAADLHMVLRQSACHSVTYITV